MNNFFRVIEFTRPRESQGFSNSRFSLQEGFLNGALVLTMLLNISKIFFKLVVDTLIIIGSI